MRTFRCTSSYFEIFGYNVLDSAPGHLCQFCYISIGPLTICVDYFLNFLKMFFVWLVGGIHPDEMNPWLKNHYFQNEKTIRTLSVYSYHVTHKLLTALQPFPPEFSSIKNKTTFALYSNIMPLLRLSTFCVFKV